MDFGLKDCDSISWHTLALKLLSNYAVTSHPYSSPATFDPPKPSSTQHTKRKSFDG